MFNRRLLFAVALCSTKWRTRRRPGRAPLPRSVRPRFGSAKGSGPHHQPAEVLHPHQLKLSGPITGEQVMTRHRRPMARSNGVSGTVPATGAVAAIGDRRAGRRRLVGTRATERGGLKEEKDEVSQSTNIHVMIKATTAIGARERALLRQHGRRPLPTTAPGSRGLPATGMTAEGTPTPLLRQPQHNNRVIRPQWQHLSLTHPPQWLQSNRI